MKTNKTAFTLAETLVVMGIIGVIAALTIPNLSQSTGNRERVTKVKKAYTTLSEAYDRAQAIYGPANEWFPSGTSVTDKSTKTAERMIEFMKISKDCKTATGCFRSTDTINDTNTTRYKVILADGTSVSFTYAWGYLQVLINIDGTSKNCDYNKNYFGFEDSISEGILYPRGHYYSIEDFVDDMKKGGKRWTTTRWIIDYENMDYLNIDANWKCTTGSGKTLNLTANPPITSCN